MNTEQPPYTWHDDVLINGQPYYTRHSAPDLGEFTDAYLADLSDTHRQYLSAHHEAAHAVTALAGQAHVHYACLTPIPTPALAASGIDGVSGGHVYACNFADSTAWAAHLGAGERANDRWLREAGLWTPTHAVGVELAAYSDRKTLLATNPHCGFGTGQDYRIVHDLADQIIDQHWQAILAVADALADRNHLTGDEIADLAHLPNGIHTCNGNPTA